MVVPVFALLLTASVFPQTETPPQGADANPALILKKQRIARVKADVLQELQTFPAASQAEDYSELGEIYWEHDPKEGNLWFTKGVDIALNPATVYANEAEKLTVLWNMLVDFPKEETLNRNRLLAQIRQIRIDESKPEHSKHANEIYVLIAEHLFRRGEEEPGFEFAVLSLKGKHPAINWEASEFFKLLKYKRESLANEYFAKMLESVKLNADPNLTNDFVVYFALSSISNFPKDDPRFKISDSQKRDLLSLLLPSIETDYEALILKKSAECGAVSQWGERFAEDYKRLLPEKSTFVEQAVAVCRSTRNLPWLTDEFRRKPRKTSQDLLNLAKEITDKKIQANYLDLAAQKARDEKNYRLSNSILDSIEKEFRNPYWGTAKIETLSKLIAEHFAKDQLPEIHWLLESAPPEYVPYIITRAMFYIHASKPPQKEFVLNLLNTARAKFMAIERFPSKPEFALNPTEFGNLTQFYVKFGFFDEAIATHDEAIKAFNRLVNNLPPETKDKTIRRRSSFASFTNQFPPSDLVFIDKYFDRIYENIGRIEAPRTRFYDRMRFLQKVLEKDPPRMTIPFSPKSDR